MPALREAYPHINGRREVDVFKRKWCVRTIALVLTSQGLLLPVRFAPRARD